MRFLLVVLFISTINIFIIKGVVGKSPGWWLKYQFTESVSVAVNSNIGLRVRTDEEIEADVNKLQLLPNDEAEAWMTGSALVSFIVYTYAYAG